MIEGKGRDEESKNDENKQKQERRGSVNEGDGNDTGEKNEDDFLKKEGRKEVAQREEKQDA